MQNKTPPGTRGRILRTLAQGPLNWRQLYERLGNVTDTELNWCLAHLKEDGFLTEAEGSNGYAAYKLREQKQQQKPASG